MFRLDKKRWVYWFAFISIFLISGSVLAASWYSTLSQSFVSTGSASTVHTFTLPSNQKVASDGYIKIELTGDFDAADEYADLYIEGTYIGKATGGAATCSTNLTKKFMLSQANLESWGADGKIVVTVKNSSAVSGCTSTQRKHGLALSVTNLVSSQPVKTLSKVRINCTTPIVEGLTGTCSAFADFSDNSTQTVTSSITNWKADRAASISTSGVITALPVSADTFVTITGNYTYNGVTMTGIGSTTVKDDSISGLREFRISCPTSFNENTSIQCRSYAKIDGAEREVTTSSTWSENASYTSITPTGGLLTAVDVIGDSGVFVKASYSYGGVTKAAEQVVTVKDVPILPTALTITCPSSIDESSTANCTAKVTLSNNTTSDVTSSSQWASSSAFATVDTNGKITTQAVTADQHININASYTASSVTKTATFPLIIKKKTSPSSAVSFTNSSNNQSLTFNGNSAWTLSPDTIYGTGGYKICESSRPTYCLNAEAGFLQSSLVEPGWLSMVFVLQDMGNGYVSMRSAHTGHYIYLNGVNIVTGAVSNTLSIAQWKQGTSNGNNTNEDIAVFLNRSNSNITLNINSNNSWVLIKDSYYNTGGYKICEQFRVNYCVNIESGKLESSPVQDGWVSSIWMINATEDGFFNIKSRWKEYIYIHIVGDKLVAATVESYLHPAQWKKISITQNAEFFSKSNKYKSSKNRASATELCEQSSANNKNCNGLYAYDIKRCFNDKEKYIINSNNKQLNSTTSVEFFYSPNCEANWIEIKTTTGFLDIEAISKNITGDKFINNSNNTFSYMESLYGKVIPSPMVYAKDDCSAKSFALIKNLDQQVFTKELYESNRCAIIFNNGANKVTVNNNISNPVSDLDKKLNSWPDSLQMYIAKNQNYWSSALLANTKLSDFTANYSFYGKSAVSEYIYDFEKQIKHSPELLAISMALYYGDNAGLQLSSAYATSFENIAPNSLVTSIDSITEDAAEATIAYQQGKITKYTLAYVIAADTGTAIITAVPAHIFYEAGMDFLNVDDGVQFLIEKIVANSDTANKVIQALSDGQESWEVFKKNDPNTAYKIEATIKIADVFFATKDVKTNFNTKRNEYLSTGKNKIPTYSKVLTGKEANQYWIDKDPKYAQNPPYDERYGAYELISTGETTFVRFYDGVNTRKKSYWMAYPDDIKGLTAEQIYNKLALPALPTKMVYVTPPKGKIMWTGTANPNFNKEGGGTQYEYHDGYLPEEAFGDEKPFSIIK